MDPIDIITFCSIVSAILAGAAYLLGRGHGRQAEREDIIFGAPDDDEQPASVSGLITPKGAGGPAGGGRRR